MKKYFCEDGRLRCREQESEVVLGVIREDCDEDPGVDPLGEE